MIRSGRTKCGYGRLSIKLIKILMRTFDTKHAFKFDMPNEVKVLLVDDETDFLIDTTEQLTHRGFEVTSVSSGEESLIVLQERSIDVVVLDIWMPGIGGIETLKRIKAKKLPTEVVILTGLADMDTAINCIDLGAFEYLVKPVLIDDLIYRIQDAYQAKVIKHSNSI